MKLFRYEQTGDAMLLVPINFILQIVLFRTLCYAATDESVVEEVCSATNNYPEACDVVSSVGN